MTSSSSSSILRKTLTTMSLFAIALLAFLCFMPVGTLAQDDSSRENNYGTVIGIDLGTTYSCVAVQRGGKVEIIANDQGNRITPSWVAFAGDERLVGDAAKNQAPQNPENTVFDAKRLVGRQFNDPDVQRDLKHWPFGLVNKGGKPMIHVKQRGEFRDFTPEEVSAMVLSKMKETAEAYLGHKVTHAVVTVPACE